MNRVNEIREAIHKLPAKDAWRLAHELREHLDALWDKQFENDVIAGRWITSLRTHAENTPAAKTDPNVAAAFATR